MQLYLLSLLLLNLRKLFCFAPHRLVFCMQLWNPLYQWFHKGSLLFFFLHISLYSCASWIILFTGLGSLPLFFTELPYASSPSQRKLNLLVLFPSLSVLFLPFCFLFMQHTNNGELRTYVSLNLALTYLKMGDSHQSELAALMKSLETDSVTDSCQSLRAALHYVRGLFAFTQLKVHDAK